MFIQLAVIVRPTNVNFWGGYKSIGSLRHCLWEFNLIQLLWKTFFYFYMGKYFFITSMLFPVSQAKNLWYPPDTSFVLKTMITNHLAFLAQGILKMQFFLCYNEKFKANQEFGYTNSHAIANLSVSPVCFNVKICSCNHMILSLLQHASGSQCLLSFWGKKLDSAGKHYLKYIFTHCYYF